MAPAAALTGEARRLAWRAGAVLDAARIFDRLDEAIAGATLVAGLTGRPGMRIAPVRVRSFAERAAQTPPPVALVFGPESHGLSEAELCACDVRVTIPTGAEFPSLNLAQAVMVAAYEVSLATGASQPPATGEPLATAAERQVALDRLKEAMLAVGFLPVENPEARFVEWRQLLGRTTLSRREVKLVLSLARRMVGVARRTVGDDSTAPKR